MKVVDLKVDGFGVWSSLELSELSDQLNVFYGPNEAGKTTLMQFVRSILYGFSPERRGRYLPPLRGDRGGGAIRATVSGKSYWISRHADPQGQGDALSVGDGQQTEHDEATLAALLGHVDEPVFNNVFAIGLREIQELSTLGDTQAASELYDLTLGMDRVSLSDVMAELQLSRSRLLAVDDRPSLVTQLLSQRQRLQSDIDELGQSTAVYLTLTAERRKLEDEIARAEAESGRLEAQARELALARALGDRWQRRVAIERQLGTLGGFGALPTDALARFDGLEKRIASRRRRFRRLHRQRTALHAEIERLNINDALSRHAMRLEALGEQQEWIESLGSQVETLEQELLELETSREETVKQWGAAAPGTAGPLASKSLDELKAAAKQLRKARREHRAFRSTKAAAEQEAETHRRKLETTLGAHKERGLTQALADAGELVSQLRKRVQVDERLDQMSRRQTELEGQAQERLEHQVLPGWALVGLGCLFVLGCALVLLFVAGMILPASLSGSLEWPVGLVGVGAAAAAAVMKVGMERMAARRLDTCHEQSQLLAKQIEQSQAERDQLDARLPRGGGPLVVRLQAAEKELARLEELLPLDAHRETAHRQAADAAQQEQQLHENYQQHRKRWSRLTRQHGLPETLAPHELPEYSRRRHHLHALDATIDEKREQLGRRQVEYNMLARRVAQLVEEIGLTPRSQRPLDQLRQCLAELKDQKSRLERREALTKQSAALRARQGKLRRQAARFRHRRQRLLQAAGTRDAAEFRRRALLQAEAGRLESERVQLAHDISTSIAGHISDERLAELLSSAEGAERLEAQLAEVRGTTAEQLNLMRENRGEMTQKLKTLLEDRQLAHKRIELDIVEKRLHDALARWRVLTVCTMMLESVREHYEREHQPLALREASTYLKRLTGGRYPRVWTPLGERALRVDDAEGHSLEVERLSRGTREQLFLALRLALVNAYAGRGVRLPLVLDDVLVNFDVGRAKAAALVLRDFARHGHQVLVFTCHEHIGKLFRHIKADVRELPDNATGHGAAAVVRRSKRSRVEEPIEIPHEIEPEAEPVAVEELEAIAPPPVVAPPEPAPVAEIAPPPLPPAPVKPKEAPPARQRPPRVERRVRRQDWSAEEFAGELADRVRPGVAWDEAPDAGTVSKDDAEAA